MTNMQRHALPPNACPKRPPSNQPPPPVRRASSVHRSPITTMTRTILSFACISMFLCSCEKRGKTELTVVDLLKAHEMVAFMVALPEDLEKEDFVRLELYSEKGVIDSAEFAYGLKPGEVLKIFIHKNSGDYRFSIVTDTFTVNDIQLKHGDARLFTWVGNSDTEQFKVGDTLAVFTIDKQASLNLPTGDDLGLRVAVNRMKK